MHGAITEGISTHHGEVLVLRWCHPNTWCYDIIQGIQKHTTKGLAEYSEWRFPVRWENPSSALKELSWLLPYCLVHPHITLSLPQTTPATHQPALHSQLGWLVPCSSVALLSNNSKFHSNSPSQAQINHPNVVCSLTTCVGLSLFLLGYFS